MKVLFNCIGLKPLFFKKGGAQKLVDYQILNLKNEHKITVVGQMAENPGNVQLVVSKSLPSVMTIPDFILNGILNLIRIWRIDTDLIVSTHERNFLASFWYSKLKNKPMLAWETDHDFWVPPVTRVKRLYFKLINQVNRIITVSQAQKMRMIKLGIDPAKISVVHNSIDTAKFVPRRQPSVPKYILYVAKFEPRKNQLLLLEIFHKLIETDSELMLYLVGPGSGAFTAKKAKPSPYYKKCSEYIKNNNLDQKIKIFEDLSDEELIEMYQNAILFAFPSRQEAFGMTLLEAMACGCCCIANDIETSAEILGEAGVLANINDTHQFAARIKSLLDNTDLREKYKTAARERAVSKFDVKKSSKEFQVLIDSKI